tara:strand:- start:118 stop:276 length:159 start_codon:yes stop_codon:yes gene_type:complete
MSEPFLYGTRLYNILDISGNGVFNTWDMILIWCYGVTAIVFYKTIVKKVLSN